MQRYRYIGVSAVEGIVAMAMVYWLSLWWLVPFGAGLWWYHSRPTEDTITKAIEGIAISSLLIVLAINTNVVGQSLIVVGYVFWRVGQHHHRKNEQFQVWQAGWLEFMALMAAFGAEAVWHWPVVIILVALYLASVVIAMAFFATSERAVRALATAWGLIVVEASFVFSVWLVNYVLPHNMLLIPQPAVVITALGYCFGSIYLAHAGSHLSKARLAEYAIIGLCLVVIVIAGTHWNGVI